MCQYLIMTINCYRQAKLGLAAIKCSYRHSAKEKDLSFSCGALNFKYTTTCSFTRQGLILQVVEELVGKCWCKHSPGVHQDYSICFWWDSCHLTASIEKSNFQSRLPRLSQKAVKRCMQRYEDSSHPEVPVPSRSAEYSIEMFSVTTDCWGSPQNHVSALHYKQAVTRFFVNNTMETDKLWEGLRCQLCYLSWISGEREDASCTDLFDIY